MYGHQGTRDEPAGMTDRLCRQRTDVGLTTLEWLLIVAAVAGLAALAVVLVQNVVDDTAEQIAGNSARITAAEVAAKAITDNDDDNEDDRGAACRRLDITYSDAFADNPMRAAFWSNPAGDKNGKCFIVSAGLKAALERASSVPAVNDATKCSAEIAKPDPVGIGRAPTPADLGGGTVTWHNDASPKCHLT